jgi:cytochrome c556
MRNKLTRYTIVILVATLLAMPAVQAQSGADPAALVEQRQTRMKALGASVKTLTGFSKGEGSAADAAKAAGVLAAAGRGMPRWWARGTAVGVGDSEASPKIWTDPNGFRQSLAAFASASARMDAAARTGDAAKVGAALRDVGGSCKGCHDGFRVKK